MTCEDVTRGLLTTSHSASTASYLVTVAVPYTRNELLLRSFARSRGHAMAAPAPCRASLEAARLLCEHAGQRDLVELGRGDVEEFLADQPARHRPTTVAVRFRSLQQFYRWMVEEQIIAASPMAGLRPPAVSEEPVPVLNEAAISRLLACMSGRDFEDRRDAAIVRLLP